MKDVGKIEKTLRGKEGIQVCNHEFTASSPNKLGNSVQKSPHCSFMKKLQTSDAAKFPSDIRALIQV